MKTGIVRRIDKNLDEQIREIAKKNDMNYSEASRELAKIKKDIKNKSNLIREIRW